MFDVSLVKLSSEATRSRQGTNAGTPSLFPVLFFPLSLSAFYPAHPCGTANVSQGLPGTRTVTKWNGRKNEWKTIKEGSGEKEDSWRERRRIRGGSGRRKRGGKKKRKVDHLAA